MRIFLAVRHAADRRQFFGDLWSSNFVPALERLGHEVVESSVDLLPASRFMHVADRFTPQEHAVRTDITERLVDEVVREHHRGPLDLVLTYFYNAHFAPEGFGRLRTLGVPTINFFCNSIYQFDLVRSVAPAADFAWYPERDAKRLYDAAGARPLHVQMGADPQLYQPVATPARRPAAVFVGQRYADRAMWLGELHRADVPFDVYGSGWTPGQPAPAPEPETEYLGRMRATPGSWLSYINIIQRTMADEGIARGIARLVAQTRYRRQSRDLLKTLREHARGRAADIAATFGEYELVLNFSNVWQDGRPGASLIPHVRLRDFEAPMARSCYLTGDSDEIREYYDIGTEIDTYRSPEELVDKSRYYLHDTSAAERLRQGGYRRARAEHTWEHRFADVFRKAGLS